MSSLTTWNRLEPSPRTSSLAPGLAAAVHDPLWFLTRQWQLGELAGHDSGSPTVVQMVAEAAPIRRLRGRDGEAVAIDVTDVPLEALVEQEDPPASTDRVALDAGAHFLRLLDAEDVVGLSGAIVAEVPARPPADAPPFVLAMSAAVPDGRQLARRLRASIDGLLDAIAAPDDAREGFRRAAARYRSWFDRLVPARPRAVTTWDPDRLEHSFEVEADLPGRTVVLHADEYPGGHLDWHAYAQSRASDAAPAGRSRTIRRTVIPSPATFPGMAHSRFWEIEPRPIDLSQFDTSADDLLGLLLVEFTVAYGDDWFLAPIDVPVGSLVAIESLEVTDSFGVRTRLRSSRVVDGAASPWRMFDLGAELPADDVMFVPPSVATSTEGPPVERVVFARDEMANLAWAIEERTDRGDGAPSERRADLPLEDQRRRQLAEDSGADLWWRLMTDVPASWHPLVPVGRAGEQPTGLELRHFRDENGRLVRPVGRLLPELDDLMLHGEELPRAGVIVERAAQRARWLGGTTVLWTGRRVRSGRGDLASGLRFDATER